MPTAATTPTAPTTAGNRRASALPPEERRSSIVAAALPLFAEHGERVTSRQIAEAAGVAEGTVFRAFGDKDELIAAVLDAALDLAPFERAVGDIDPDLPFEERLTRAVEMIQRRVVDVWAVVSGLGPKAREHASRPLADSGALAAIFGPERARLRVDPVAAARLTRALTLSLTHPMLAGEPLTATEIVQVVLHGIDGHGIDAAAAEATGDGA